MDDVEDVDVGDDDDDVDEDGRAQVVSPSS